MLPVYYDPTPLCPSEIISAKESWKMIDDDLSPCYFEKASSDLELSKLYPTCLDWFISVFYERLFDIHPVNIFRNCINMFLPHVILRYL